MLNIFFNSGNLGPVLLIFLYRIHRAICGEAPGRDTNPGRAELVAGILTTRQPHLTMLNNEQILNSESEQESDGFHKPGAG